MPRKNKVALAAKNEAAEVAQPVQEAPKLKTTNYDVRFIAVQPVENNGTFSYAGDKALALKVLEVELTRMTEAIFAEAQEKGKYKILEFKEQEQPQLQLPLEKEKLN